MSEQNGNGWKKEAVWWGYLIAVVAVAVIGSVAIAKLRATDHKLRTQQIVIAAQVKQNARAAKAECALSRDLRERVIEAKAQLAKSREFFDSHPHALSDIPRPLILSGFETQRHAINGQRRTIMILVQTLGPLCSVKVPSAPPGANEK